MMETVKAATLHLGDTVRMGPGPFMDAVVTRIEPAYEWVHLFRPYATTADFEYTGGVIAYIGIEQYAVPFKDDVILMQRADPKR